MVEFTVSEVRIVGSDNDLHLYIQDPLARLICQLCEDGREEEVTAAVAAWKAEQDSES